MFFLSINIAELKAVTLCLVRLLKLVKIVGVCIGGLRFNF